MNSKTSLGLRFDFREQGTILISDDGHFPASARPVNPEHLHSMEPALAMSGARGLTRSRLGKISVRRTCRSDRWIHGLS